MLHDATRPRQLLAGVLGLKLPVLATLEVGDALDTLIDPTDPPPPWDAPLSQDPRGDLRTVRELITEALTQDHYTNEELLALAMCGRHVAAALAQLDLRPVAS